MKTTIDLPEELVRDMKLRAVKERRRLKEVAAEAIRRGLSMRNSSSETRKRRRVKLPIIPAPPGAPRMDLSGERIHELEMGAETKSHDPSLRR